MQGMIKANRDLQEVKDSGSIIRGVNTNKTKKEGKIFTYQANEPVSFLFDIIKQINNNI